MRICRFDNQRVGLVNGDIVTDVTDVTTLLPAVRWPYEPGDHFMRNLVTLVPALAGAAASGASSAQTYSLSEIALLSPVANPGKVVAMADDAAEPALFLKPPGEIGGAGRAFAVPKEAPALYGMALAAIVGRVGRNLQPADALAGLAGYTIALARAGTTVRDFGLALGPYLVTAEEIADPASLTLRMTRNASTVQDAGAAQIRHSLADVVVEASRYMQLDPGDIVLAGSPDDSVPLSPGDRVACQITGIGTLRVTAGPL